MVFFFADELLSHYCEYTGSGSISISGSIMFDMHLYRPSLLSRRELPACFYIVQIASLSCISGDDGGDVMWWCHGSASELCF